MTVCPYELCVFRCPFRPFTFESPGETPGAGTVLGIDAEFVSLAPAVKEPHPEVSLFYILCMGNVIDVVSF